MHRPASILRFLVATAFIAGAFGAPAAIAAARDHLRVRAYVVDFDPLTDGGSALTVAHAWSDPFALDDAYIADVARASAGIVSQRIVRTTVVRGYPPKPGFAFTNATYEGCLADSSPTSCKALIDYAAVLAATYDRRIGSPCAAIARGRADEIWLWGGPWFGYLEQLLVTPRSLCPDVDRPFTVMGFNYERGVAEMVHDLGHRAEARIQAGIGLELWDRFDGQRGRYGEDFDCPAEPDAGHPEVGTTAHAGNVHFPPNAYCHYQYDRAHPILSDADDWANFPFLTGRQTTIDASTWGATQEGFLIWWLGRFPRQPGTVDGLERDWWRYVYPPS